MMASEEQLLPPVVVEVAPDEMRALAAAEGVAAPAPAAAAAAAAAVVGAPTASGRSSSSSSSSNNNNNDNGLIVAIAGHALRHGVGVLSWVGDAIGEPIIMPPNESGNDDNSAAAAAAAAAADGGVVEQAVAGEEAEENEGEEEETAEVALAADPVVPGSSRSNTMDPPLSILGLAICMGMAFIAGIGVTYDAGELSTPATCISCDHGADGRNAQPTAGAWFFRSTSAAAAVETATPRQTVYNIKVYESGQREEVVNLAIVTEMKSPPSPPPPLSDAEREANFLSSLASQVPKLFARVFPVLTSSATGDGGSSSGNSGSGGSGGGGGDSSGDDGKGVEADLSFWAYNPWTEQGQAAFEALVDGPWV